MEAVIQPIDGKEGMVMTRKSALYALAVVVLMGGMASIALAEYDWSAGAVKPDLSVSATPEQGMDHSDSGEIREPMETGAVPERAGGSSDLNSNASGNEPAVEYGGQTFRPGIDSGP